MLFLSILWLLVASNFWSNISYENYTTTKHWQDANINDAKTRVPTKQVLTTYWYDKKSPNYFRL